MEFQGTKIKNTCECGEFKGSYSAPADEVYEEHEIEELAEQGLSIDFQFDICLACDGIIGIFG
jgi:hypothetical protein